jgi:cyclopropane fatty-acyl-phospholipid synthase-like methyltransferase/DUF1365 family protein
MCLGRGGGRDVRSGVVNAQLGTAVARTDAARIYDCTIRHVRRDPVRNDFTYRTIMWLVDLDRIPRLPLLLRPLAEFRSADHAGDPCVSLRRNVEAYLAQEGIDLRGGRILMLTAARSLGHVFNPLTVYWCHDEGGRLVCIVAEVHNTYGGRHRYLLRHDQAAARETRTAQPAHVDTEKDFYVSPFYPVTGRYRMSLPEPGDDLALSIRYDPPGAAPFSAVLRGHGAPVTIGGIVRHALRQPSPTLLAAARIRAQGIKLYLRGLPVVPRESATVAPTANPANPVNSATPTAQANPAHPANPVAPRLATLFRQLTHTADLPIGLRAWDGSEAGPEGLPRLVLASPRALRRVLWAPNELGLAQAYVTGELDVEGDVAEGIRRLWASVDPTARPPRVLTPRHLASLGAAAFRFGALGPRPAAPASQVRVHGVTHSPARDRAVIAHHYDLSNDFYALLLDESMAYSSAYWREAGPDADPQPTLADAQRAKLDLICRKLRLAPGMRLLDVGCGWGGLLMHAAEHYGVEVLGLTLSRQQASYINAELARRGLGKRASVRIQHFREFSQPGAFDVAASIEMGEHVGAEAYPVYTRMLQTSVKAGGRVLIQQMSRASTAAPGGGPFIESFIAPDMHMRPVAETVAQWEAAGFAVLGTESLREDYVLTIRAWRENLEQAWQKAVDVVGEETARVWRLYLAGGQVAFEQGRMGVEQILAVRGGRVGD